MKGFLAVTRREIVQRRLILAVAAVGSLLPLVVPALRGVSGAEAAATRSWVAFLLSAAFAIGLAAGSGASMLAPAIASRRIAFDFSKPLSALAIWGGHLAAATLLAVVSVVILWIPARLAGSHIPWSELFVSTELSGAWPVLLVAGLMAVFAALHAVSVMLRSHSPLVALDAALAVAVGFGFSGVLSRLPAFLEGPKTVVILVILSPGVALLLAGFASVAHGRTDIRAAHRALSLVLWSLLAVTLMGLHAYVWWVLPPGRHT